VRTAFQFSGGKDSTAALFLLRDEWSTFTVYSLLSDDMFPETKEFILDVAKDLPRFTWVETNIFQSISDWGIPSDVIPILSSQQAKIFGPVPVPLQYGIECCARARMAPMLQRMLADNIECVVRGQRNEEFFKAPVRDGDVVDGMKIRFPIQGWTEQEVWAYLRKINRIPPLYANGMLHGNDCMSCSAWLVDKRAAYIRENHPEAYKRFSERVRIIQSTLRDTIQRLEDV
jgi:phosphoadenosine phosphosulfate reductase